METLDKLEVLNLISELRSALSDHHTGSDTSRPFAMTWQRDKALIQRADNYISAFTRKEGE